MSLSTLLDIAQPLPDARFVRFVAYSDRDHDTSLLLEYARDHVVLAHEVDGNPLTRDHGAPVRSVCEGKYFYKSVKWLGRIEVLPHDRLGFWERGSAYHNNADPWLEQRYNPRLLDADEFKNRLAVRDFSNIIAIKDGKFKKLKEFDLTGVNFENAMLKNCDLSHANLREARCRGANFTLTRFNGSNLFKADFSGCDLEGADFRRADLREADLRGTSLTVTKFYQHHFTKLSGTKFLRMDIDNEGLADEDRRYLLDVNNGAIIE